MGLRLGLGLSDGEVEAEEEVLGEIEAEGVIDGLVEVDGVTVAVLVCV